MYTVYREPQIKVSCNHDQDGLKTHPGYPDPDESGPPERDNVMDDGPPELYKVMEYPAYSGPPERDKTMNTGPPEENLSPPDKDKVTKYSWMLVMYSGPLERDKVTSSGPLEVNLSPTSKHLCEY